VDGAGGPRPAPVLGADTAAVLSGLLGLSAAEVRALTETNVAGGPAAERKGHECDA
jgi:crotonobetainyl-CoA:carnitine CoA-transferase CaiB-like acyl-CoA transferase